MANWALQTPKLRASVKIAFGILVAVVILGFANKRQEDRVCTGIYVRIDNQLGNYFINEQDVISQITANGDLSVIGMPFYDIDLKKIEQKVRLNKFVYDAQVYRSLNGQLMVDVIQNKPIARIISDKIKDRYISTEGEVLPVSNRYTARTVLISGWYADHLAVHELQDQEYGQQLYDMLQYINNDPFWKAQVAQLEIDKKGNILIYTQVSKQVVEFGTPVDYDKKFKKLRLFYKRILPGKGWNSYDRVSVKYKDQIICE